MSEDQTPRIGFSLGLTHQLSNLPAWCEVYRFIESSNFLAFHFLEAAHLIRLFQITLFNAASNLGEKRASSNRNSDRNFFVARNSSVTYDAASMHLSVDDAQTITFPL
jgi:hypothetical protein